jgi:hypothetical protein
MFYFKTVSGSESDPESEFFLSDSDPAKIFGFFRLRMHNTGLPSIDVLVDHGNCGLLAAMQKLRASKKGGHKNFRNDAFYNKNYL